MSFTWCVGLCYQVVLDVLADRVRPSLSLQKTMLSICVGEASDDQCIQSHVAQTLLGGVKLSLEGTVANARSFRLTASVGDLKLGGGVVLLHAGLQFESGTNPTVGIVGSIELNNPPITMNAAIRLTLGGVKLEGSMMGCWSKAFGIEVLTIM